MRARTRLTVSILFLVVVSAGGAAGQSLLREGDGSGGGAAAGFFASTEAKGLSVEGTWTAWGRADVTLGYARVSFDPLPGATAGYTGHQPGAQISWLALRQDDRVPVCVQLGAGYSLLSYTGDGLPAGDLDGHGPQLAAVLARRVRCGADLTVVPAIGFQYARTSFTVGPEDAEATVHTRVWKGVVHLVSHGDVYVGPTVELSDGAKAVYGLSAGFLFPRRPDRAAPDQ